jgi:peptidoglycan/LPS O-acetylase OafA/YrhL
MAAASILKSLSDSPNLDVLRSFAVLAVATAHFYRYCFDDPRFSVFAHNLGVGGVCFFFVHTSLVLFGSMERTKTSNLTRSFYIRRAFRIYPLCWVCILLVLATGWTDVPHERLVKMGWHGIVANAARLQNLTSSGDVVGPLWSLPWEVQMYLVLPALFVLLKKSDRPILLAVAMWFGLTTLAVFATAFRVPGVLFHVTVFAPMFFGGVIAFHLGFWIRPRISSFLWPLVVSGLLVGRCLLLEGYSLQNPRNVAVNAIICFLLGISIPLFKAVHQPLLTNSAHQIAKYSYGIYLFHIPALMFILKYFGQYPVLFKMGAFVVITCAASVSSYQLVEHPLIQFGKRFAERFERPRLKQMELEVKANS